MKKIYFQAKYVYHLFVIKFFRSQTFNFILLQFFVNYLYCRPIINLLNDMHHKINICIYPFIISNIFYSFLFLIEIIYFYSDVPFMQYQNMYQIIRTGKKTWIFGQIFSVIIQAIMIIILNFMMILVFLNRHFILGMEWDKVTNTLALTNLGEQYSFLFGIPYETLNLYNPLELFCLTFFIGTLVISFLGMLMFMLSAIFNRFIAIIVATVMVAMIFLVENAHHLVSLRVSLFVPLGWIRVALIGTKKFGSFILPPLSYIIIFLVSSLILFSIIIYYRFAKIEFNWYRED